MSTKGNLIIPVTYYQVDLCNLEDLKSVCSQIVNDKLVPDVLLFNGTHHSTSNRIYIVDNFLQFHISTMKNRFAVT